MKTLSKQGMTFMELMITVTIVGILASAAVLPQLKTIEAGKRRSARTILEAIAGGEKVYKTFNTANNHIYCEPGPIWLPAPAAPTVGDCSWDEIYSDNPNENPAGWPAPLSAAKPALILGVRFSVTVTNAGNGFIATAQKTAGSCKDMVIDLDETGTELPIVAPRVAWPLNGC